CGPRFRSPTWTRSWRGCVPAPAPRRCACARRGAASWSWWGARPTSSICRPSSTRSPGRRGGAAGRTGRGPPARPRRGRRVRARRASPVRELPPRLDPRAIEPSLYREWRERGWFHVPASDVLERGRDPFVIVIPPPNVTAVLHMGHGLNNTLQDVLV